MLTLIIKENIVAKIISFFNHKGGVGKTTLAYNVAWSLAEKGKKVLMLDGDAQANLTEIAVDNEFLDDYSQMNLFANYDGISLLTEPNEDFFSNHWLTAIVIDSKITGFTREDLRLHLLEDNIESRPLWKPMHLQPVFKDESYYGNGVSDQLFENGLCLPSGSSLTDEDKTRIADKINQFLNRK